MKMHVLAITGVLLWGLPAAPSIGAEGNYEEVTAQDTALMELYFGEEQLVEGSTRHPKPLSQIPENATIVTAKEIEAMRATTVAEVLERVPGVSVQFHGRGEPGSRSSLHIQGSGYEHVLVLVDGIRWNNVGSDLAETNSIPVEVIDRIEVIKGAASSAWGSALGGVVNIITKSTGRDKRPHGTASLAIGEHGTKRYDGELSGGISDFGYYLHAGRRESDGILNDRFFDGKSLFGKFSYALSPRTRFSGEIGYSQPESRYTNVLRPDLDLDFSHLAENDQLLYSADVENKLTDSLHFYFQLYGQEDEFTDTEQTASIGTRTKITNSGEQQGINSRLAWENTRQTVVFGAEYLERESTDRNDLTGVATAPHRDEIWALYLNDTIRLGDLTLSPGLRFDHLSLADDQVSPSLGLTYRWSAATLLRAGASRGFRKPTVGLQTVNPELESETTWTYQAGIETIAIPYVWLKTTAFRHESDHAWTGEFVNDGQVKRTGLEVAARTQPVHNVSLGANYTFVDLNPDLDQSDSQYEVDLLLEYDDGKEWQAQLYCQYVWWSDYFFSPPEWNGEFSETIWDFVLNRTLTMNERLRADLFLKVHNLFNGTQFHDELLPDAPRWVEGGVRLHF